MFQKSVSYCFFVLIIASAIVPLYSPRNTDTLLHSSQRLMAAGGRILDPLDPVNGLRGSIQTGITVSDRGTNLTTDKETYSPGDLVEIEVTSRTNDMNGSLEWYLESPIGEVAFGFNSSYQDIFQDPTFDNTISDWNSTDWSGTAELTAGYLNLTEESDGDIISDEIFFYNATNPTYGVSNPRYLISFDYFSRGSNLINNSGFENGSWDWTFELGNVTFPSEAENASEGIRYAQINATQGTLILYQNITAWTGGRSVTFSAKATGTTDANYWKLRIEEFNSTGYRLRSTDSGDSRNALTDEKEYAFLKILSLKTHINTTYIRASFIGMDTGSQGDGFYTGRLDECLLAEVPPALVFSYWDKAGEWRNVTLPSGTHEWDTIEYDVELAASAPLISKTFRFILPDGSDVINITTAYWGIDNIAVNLATKPAQKTGISHQTDSVGEIESTWFHRGFRENLTSQFIIKAETPDETTGYADSQATIQLQLPKHQIYFGSWIFVFKIHQEDDGLNPIFPVRLINLSFTLEEQMNFVTQDTYLLRGSTNKTVGNDSVFTEYFEQETSISTISPGDNVTILGYLEANSTPTEWYDLSFLNVGTSTTSIIWHNPNEARGNITWTTFGFIPYNKEGITLIDGNFSNPLDNKQTFGLNFQVPARGIYGNLTTNLTISLLANNSRPGGIGGDPLVLTLPLSLPEVKFHVNVLKPEHLPEKPEYVLTEYLEGNISVNILNFNDSLGEDFFNRNITSKLDLPLSDLDLIIFLDDLNQTPAQLDIAQDFHYNIIGHTITWLDQVDPHLVPGFYEFMIRWNTPFQLNVSEQAFLNITTVTLQVKGSLSVQWSISTPQIEQGAQTTINFTIFLEESNRSIGGLNLEGIIDANVSLGRLVVYEGSEVYKIDFDIDLDMGVGTHSLSIRIGDRDLLPPLSFEVIAPPKPPTDGDSVIDLALGIAGFGFFVIVAIVIVGVMFWIEKSI